MVPKKTALGFVVGLLAPVVGCGDGWAEGPRADQPAARSTAAAEDPKGKPAAAPQLDPAIVALVDAAFREGETDKRAEISTLRAAAKRFRTTNQRRLAEEADAKADALEGQVFWSFPKLRGPFKSGQLGWVYEPFEVVSIVDDANVVVIASDDADFQTVWLKGISTKKMTNGQKFGLDEDTIFHVSGTREYTTALGTQNRVLVIEPIDLEPYKKKNLEKVAAELDAKAAKETMPKASAEDLAEKTNRAAAAKLKLAKQFLGNGDTKTGRRWLSELVRDYPNTPAAADAQKLLAELPK